MEINTPCPKCGSDNGNESDGYWFCNACHRRSPLSTKIMTPEQKQSITDNALAGSQFLASAIIEGNKAAVSATLEDCKAARLQFQEHLDCAKAHFEAAFDEREGTPESSTT